MLASHDFAAAMRERLCEVFEPQLLAVEVDDNLVSKAAAGATRIRIRGQTHFRQDDLEQLVQHEAFVHSLTAINGSRQPQLTALGCRRRAP